MMNVMMTYNPVLFLLFTANWTAGMAAMMFPAIVPLVLLYNRLITNKLSQSSTLITESKFSHTFMMILFVGMYLIWTLTGIALLSGWSFPINSVVKLLENNHIGIIFGTIILNESKAELSRELMEPPSGMNM